MQIEFTLKNTHASGGDIRSFLNEKTGKLTKFFQGRTSAKWIIAYENDEHVAHLHVVGTAGEYFGEARHHNILSSIEEAVDRVERQLKKHKEIIKDHHK